MSSSPSPDDDSDTDEQSPIIDPEKVIDGETPLAIHPRGGAREVGRSCYQVETPDGTYLVDCGINQGSGGQFPDFRGLAPESIDAVFLTHAHIDHSGGLPVLEHRNLLAPDAPIICTQATAALAHVLLHDSLKIHLEESDDPGRQQQFTRSAVEDVLARFEPLTGYDDGRIGYHISTEDTLTYRFGDAGHLLGSAWLSLEMGGRRVVFSGDLGGRSAHLHDIETPPSADTLILESTYGDRLTHPSFDDARTELYEQTIEAIRQDIPVLIPTFAVGRAQEILQIFRERWRSLDEPTQQRLQIIYDGLATEATDRYHAFTAPEYINESVMNYMQNAADFEPFVPEIAQRPKTPADRPRFLSEDTPPIIVAPSGMLTGGLSPAYLHDLLTYYDQLRVIFTGYQAEGTLGREIVSADEAAQIAIQTRPLREVSDGQDENGTNRTDPEDGPPIFEHTIPSAWIRSIRGLSGHAAGNALLQFARHVDPNHVAFVHGEPSAQQELLSHFESNLDADVITRAALQTSIPVYPPKNELVAYEPDRDTSHPNITVRTTAEADEDHITSSAADERADSVQPVADSEGVAGQSESEAHIDSETAEYLTDRLAAIDSELTALRNDEQRSEATLRALIRDEVQTILENQEEETE
jgi:Cft2 family RNA processing exonuclease